MSAQWEALPSMIARRGELPTLVAAQDRVFVFGGHPNYDDLFLDLTDKDQCHTLIKSWAEYCDPLSPLSSWNHFPDSPPVELLQYSNVHSTCAVYPKKKLIFFWIMCEHVFSFNYETWKWNLYKPTDSICQGPHWSASVVVVHDFLFWHYEDTIYARDLSMPPDVGITLPIYKFDDTAYNFSHFLFNPGATHLFHPGNDQLCVFWMERDTNNIYYFTFRLQVTKGGGGATLHLVPGPRGVLHSPDAVIADVLQLSFSGGEGT